MSIYGAQLLETVTPLMHSCI